ncbi:MAG: ribonuclease E inhibitor RraB [Fidelibacterota bacterium]
MNIDKITLDLLARCGSDFNRTHHFDFYLYFRQESAARAARLVLERERFTVTLIPPEVSPEWLVLAGKDMLPEEVELRDLRHWFEKLAEDLKGDYDGWETAFTPSP